MDKLLLYAGLGLALGLEDKGLGLGLGLGFAGLVTGLVLIEELITKLGSRTLRPSNVLSLLVPSLLVKSLFLVFSNNIKDGISDIRDIKRRIMACP